MTGFDTRKENLLCLMVLDDNVAARLNVNPGVGFWRAFIVEDRATRTINVNFRFRYATGDSWYHIEPKEKEQADRPKLLAKITADLEFMLRTALRVFGIQSLEESAHVVMAYYPPEPEDPAKTLDWLIEQDLVEVKRIDVTSKAG